MSILSDIWWQVNIFWYWSSIYWSNWFQFLVAFLTLIEGNITTFFYFTTLRCSAKFRALLDFLSQGLQRAHIPSWRTHLSTSFLLFSLLQTSYLWLIITLPGCLASSPTHVSEQSLLILFFNHNSICFPLYFLPGCFPSDFQFLSLPLWHISSVRDSAVLAFVEQSASWFLYASVHHLATKSLIVLTCQFVNMKLYFMWALFVAFQENSEILKHLFASASIWFW